MLGDGHGLRKPDQPAGRQLRDRPGRELQRTVADVEQLIVDGDRGTIRVQAHGDRAPQPVDGSAGPIRRMPSPSWVSSRPCESGTATRSGSSGANQSRCPPSSSYRPSGVSQLTSGVSGGGAGVAGGRLRGPPRGPPPPGAARNNHAFRPGTVAPGGSCRGRGWGGGPNRAPRPPATPDPRRGGEAARTVPRWWGAPPPSATRRCPCRPGAPRCGSPRRGSGASPGSPASRRG